MNKKFQSFLNCAGTGSVGPGGARRDVQREVVAVAVLIDAVVGDVDRAGMDRAIERRAVILAEQRAVAVAIDIGDEPDRIVELVERGRGGEREPARSGSPPQ